MNENIKEIWAKGSERLSVLYARMGRKTLIDRLAGEKLIAIGFRDREIELIPYDFWITGWKAYFDDDNAWNKTASYRQIKCFSRSEMNSSKRVSLNEAWDTHSDLAAPGFNYREQLHSLARGNGAETLEETKKRETAYSELENSLKRQFRYAIKDRSFVAFGYEINAPSGLSERVQIGEAFFDPDDRMSQVIWEDNRLEYEGHVFTGIEVQPDSLRLKELWPADAPVFATFTKYEAETLERPKTNDAGGRPNTKKNVKRLARELFANDAKFIAMKDRRQQAREIRAQLKGERYRMDDEFAGLKTDTIKRWIGEVASEK